MFGPLRRWIHSLRDLPTRMDQRFAFAVSLWVYYALLVANVVILACAYLRADSQTMPVSIGPYLGLGGALTVGIGAFALARPIIRSGGYKAWHEQSRIFDGGTFETTPEQIREEEEGLRDARAVNVIAPAFGIVGTIINGALGFFS